jgi:hypothetical protein
MEAIYMEVIILLLLVWLFGNKILPQVIIMFLTIIMMVRQITINTTGLKSMISILILYAVIILYSSLSASSKEIIED